MVNKQLDYVIKATLLYSNIIHIYSIISLVIGILLILRSIDLTTSLFYLYHRYVPANPYSLITRRKNHPRFLHTSLYSDSFPALVVARIQFRLGKHRIAMDSGVPRRLYATFRGGRRSRSTGR